MHGTNKQYHGGFSQRRNYLVRVCALSLLATTLPFVTAGPASATPSSKSEQTFSSTSEQRINTWDEENYVLSRAAEGILPLLSEQSSFSGLSINGGVLEIQASSDSGSSLQKMALAALSNIKLKAEDAYLMPAVLNVQVTEEAVPASLLQMQKTQDQITADFATWKKDGVELGTWGPDPRSGKVSISLLDYSPERAEQLKAHYGDTITVMANSAKPTEVADRGNDASPWTAGDVLVFDTGNGCTSWFRMDAGGKAYSATAAHCGGSDVQQGVSYGSGSAAHFGTVIRRVDSVSGDAESIHIADGHDDVWAGFSSKRDVFADSTADVVGHLVCYSGFFTTEVCNNKIIKTGQSLNIGGSIRNNMVITQNQSGQSPAQKGDSGGPVYELNSSGAVRAVGMITAKDASSSTTAYYQPSRNVEAVLGTTINCGATAC